MFKNIFDSSTSSSHYSFFFNPTTLFWENVAKSAREYARDFGQPYVSGQPIDRLTTEGRREMDRMKASAIEVEFEEIIIN